MQDLEKLIKPCSVRLQRSTFSRIRIKCTVQSEEGTHECNLIQVGANTFNLRIKRKRCDELKSDDHSEYLNPSKKRKVKSMLTGMPYTM